MLKKLQIKNSSPDLTLIGTVNARDALPTMADLVESGCYNEIVRMNNCTHIKAIKPGMKLYFQLLKN
jgi:hypothetical protein